VKTGFTPIQLDNYVELHLRANPCAEGADLVQELRFVIAAYRSGTRCRCGAPEWIIGSAHAELGCFTCITGHASADQGYEMEVAEDGGV
jgi:hypothetical protein